jgi:NitT/TauT family transport system substrate-binding protein
LQTRDQTWKPDYRAAVVTALETLKILKRADSDLDMNAFISDKYVRQAFADSGLNYDAQLAQYGLQPLVAKDFSTGKPIGDFKRVAQIWLTDEALVRHYASPEAALKDLAALERAGKTARAVYAQDAGNGIKLLAPLARFVRGEKGDINAFLLKGDAEAWATAHGGVVLDFAGTKAAVVAAN